MYIKYFIYLFSMLLNCW